MALNHKIAVTFARSIKRKIDVHIENLHDLQYESTNNFKIHSYSSGGVIKTQAMITITVTLVILIIIAAAVMLSLNG